MDQEVDEAIIKLERVAERRIQEAMNAGEFDNLPGMGKPLSNSDDNPYTPADMRAAFKVLSNSGYAPDWMVQAQQIDEATSKLRHAADRHFAFLRRRLAEVGSDPFAARRLGQEIETLRQQHRRAAKRHAEVIEEINRKINTFNQMVPIASLMMVPLSLTLEMEQFEARVPAYLNYYGRDLSSP